VSLKPDIESLDGKLVHFKAGTSLEVDEILAATGYQMTIPYLDESDLEWQGQRIGH
jgi:hypothetical protein